MVHIDLCNSYDRSATTLHIGRCHATQHRLLRCDPPGHQHLHLIPKSDKYQRCISPQYSISVHFGSAINVPIHVFIDVPTGAPSGIPSGAPIAAPICVTTNTPIRYPIFFPIEVHIRIIAIGIFYFEHHSWCNSPGILIVILSSLQEVQSLYRSI